MNDETSAAAAGGERAQRPRSPRVPVSFAVSLEGEGADGKRFETRGVAVKVSRGGATIITDAPVQLGASVRLTPPFGRRLDAEVNGVWADAEDGKQRIGVKLLDPNGWFAE
jgi:hypothetical protein